MSYVETERQLLDTTETAKYVRRVTTTLWKWRRDGYGPPYVRIAGRIYYDLVELDAWLSDQQ